MSWRWPGTRRRGRPEPLTGWRRLLRGLVRTAAAAGWLAAILAAGCSPGTAARHRATVDSCYAFGVHALERRVTVTAVPEACRGLSHAQVNLAAARAVREVVGPRPKAAARRLANRDAGYLGHLIGSGPPPEGQPPAAAPAVPPADLGSRLAALAAWLLTAAAGSALLAGWLRHGRPRRAGPRRPGRSSELPPAIIIGHFAVAIAGLVTWIAFVVTDVAALAWAAVGLILVTAALGMAALGAALPDPAPSAGLARPAAPLATLQAETAAPAKVRMPVIIIAVHGVLATATILIVLLAAISAP